MNTVIVNLFAGPSAGKTTCAWEIASKLKKRGIEAEYVSEYAKELVWDGNNKFLDGTVEHQKIIYEEQNRRVQRLLGKVDVVVTDSPAMLSLMYIKEANTEFTEKVLKDFKAQQNFNLFINRGQNFQQIGRLHNLEESIAIDEKIKSFLKSNEIFFGTYNHKSIDVIVDNIIKNIKVAKKTQASTDTQGAERIKQKDVSDSDTSQKKEKKQFKPYYREEELLAIPISEILEQYGYTDIKQAGNKLVVSVRDEKEPSLFIYPETNTFYDFGVSVGGNGINLVAFLDGCDKEEALYKLADMFNLQPKNTAIPAQRNYYISNAQFAKIGIAGDKATKNFDFDFETYSEKQTENFAKKYDMSMAELAKAYPKIYNQTLKMRAVPFVYDLRNDYFANCFMEDRLCRNLGIDILSDNSYWQTIEKYKLIAEDAEKILKTAITDKDLKSKVTYHKYDIKKDILALRKGRIQFEDGTIPYATLKQVAKEHSEDLLFEKHSYDEYLDMKDSVLKDKEYAAHVKGDEVNISARPSALTLTSPKPGTIR